MAGIRQFEASRVPLRPKYELFDASHSYKKLARKTRNETRRKNFRLKLFQVSHFKEWIVTNQMINAISIGGEITDPCYNEFRLFADEEIKEEISSICVGTMKAFSIANLMEEFIV
jgi:hypothetical protein